MLIAAAKVDLAYNKERISDEQRPVLGQSFPLGDTGNGESGVRPVSKVSRIVLAITRWAWPGK
jgi:hypothetical protein